MQIIGLLGGTFDPPHNAHLAMANAFLRLFPDSQVIFLPAGEPYHKNTTQTASQHRLNMCLAAVADNPQFAVSDVDMVRNGATYTYDTVRIFREICPDASLWWIMGEDSLRYVHQWHKANSLLSLVNFAIARRGDESDFPEITQQIIKQGEQAAQNNLATGQMRFLDMPKNAISSTKIRQALADNHLRLPENIAQQIPTAVLDYIRQNGLYQ
ncbi:MAG: nicotinate-nucleotide adenylyltransferase [Neisseriaceae bacterium]|nr:nicotinate-nucleotide adenylyltransferase [Neisseriaceae bacterium]